MKRNSLKKKLYLWNQTSTDIDSINRYCKIENFFEIITWPIEPPKNACTNFFIPFLNENFFTDSWKIYFYRIIYCQFSEMLRFYIFNWFFRHMCVYPRLTVSPLGLADLWIMVDFNFRFLSASSKHSRGKWIDHSNNKQFEMGKLYPVGFKTVM